MRSGTARTHGQPSKARDARVETTSSTPGSPTRQGNDRAHHPPAGQRPPRRHHLHLATGPPRRNRYPPRTARPQRRLRRLVPTTKAAHTDLRRCTNATPAERAHVAAAQAPPGSPDCRCEITDVPAAKTAVEPSGLVSIRAAVDVTDSPARSGTGLEEPKTNDPLGARVSTRPSARSWSTARRTVVRLRPVCCTSTDSVGNRSPAARVPLRISSPSRPANQRH